MSECSATTEIIVSRGLLINQPYCKTIGLYDHAPVTYTQLLCERFQCLWPAPTFMEGALTADNAKPVDAVSPGGAECGLQGLFGELIAGVYS